MMKDKEGYEMVEMKFSLSGYDFEFLEDLGNDWKIYKKSKKENPKNPKFELVKLRKQEAYSFKGKFIPAKWLYPTDTWFGKYGFDCVSLEIARERHKEIIQNAEEKEEKSLLKNKDIVFPNKDFCIKDVVELNQTIPYSIIYSKIKILIANKEIKELPSKTNNVGRKTNFYRKV